MSTKLPGLLLVGGLKQTKLQVKGDAGDEVMGTGPRVSTKGLTSETDYEHERIGRKAQDIQESVTLQNRDLRAMCVSIKHGPKTASTCYRNKH